MSRRQLIATGAAGTAGALGLAACSTSVEGEANAGVHAQPAADQASPGGAQLYRRFKPFLAKRFSEDEHRPPAGRGLLEQHLLGAWVTRQLITQFDPAQSYAAPADVDANALAYFQEYEDRLKRLIDIADALKSDATNLTWTPGLASDIIILPPKPPQPPPTPGDDSKPATRGALIPG
jgi:hypothetical protein